MNTIDDIITLTEDALRRSAHQSPSDQARHIIETLGAHNWLINPDDLSAIIARQKRDREEVELYMIINDGEDPDEDKSATRLYDPDAVQKAVANNFAVWTQQRRPWKRTNPSTTGTLD